MVTKLICASALVALAGVAQGAAFQVNTVSAGVLPGDLGNPITWTHATNAAAYNNATVSGVFGPAADLIDGVAAAKWDSYLGMDPIGPSAGGDPSTSGDGYNTNTNLGTTSGSVGFVASGGNGSIQGGWFSTAFINSGAGDRMFVTQLTLRPGSSDPTTTGLFVNIRNDGDNSGSGALGPVKFGSANASNNGGAWAQSYYLDFVKTTVSGLNATFNGGSSYAIYVVAAVPAPGVAGLAGLAGIAAIRRRRA